MHNEIIFKKNVADRKMTTKFKNPKILLFQGSIDIEVDMDQDLFLYMNIKQKASVYDFIKKENSFINQIFSKINAFKSQVIFIEKSINPTLLTML